MSATSSSTPSAPCRPAAKADELVDEAKAAGGGNHPVTVHAKMLRLELLRVKADLERELETWVLGCTKCGLDVHWVSGLRIAPGHWAHRKPASRQGLERTLSSTARRRKRLAFEQS